MRESEPLAPGSVSLRVSVSEKLLRRMSGCSHREGTRSGPSGARAVLGDACPVRGLSGVDRKAQSLGIWEGPLSPRGVDRVSARLCADLRPDPSGGLGSPFLRNRPAATQTIFGSETIETTKATRSAGDAVVWRAVREAHSRARLTAPAGRADPPSLCIWRGQPGALAKTFGISKEARLAHRSRVELGLVTTQPLPTTGTRPRRRRSRGPRYPSAAPPQPTGRAGQAGSPFRGDLASVLGSRRWRLRHADEHGLPGHRSPCSGRAGSSTWTWRRSKPSVVSRGPRPMPCHGGGAPVKRDRSAYLKAWREAIVSTSLPMRRHTGRSPLPGAPRGISPITNGRSRTRSLIDRHTRRKWRRPVGSTVPPTKGVCPARRRSEARPRDRAAYHAAYRATHRDEHAVATARWAADNPESRRESARRRRPTAEAPLHCSSGMPSRRSSRLAWMTHEHSCWLCGGAGVRGRQSPHGSCGAHSPWRPSLCGQPEASCARCNLRKGARLAPLSRGVLPVSVSW